MTDPRPPGWYDEPSGDPARLRWWDGRSWTSVSRQRSAFEALPAPDGPAAAGDLLDSTAPRPAAPWSRRRRAVLAAGVAVALVVALAVLGVPGRQDLGGGLADRGPGSTGPGSAGPATPPEPAPTTARAVSGRVVDQVAKLSYDVLPGEWREWDRDTFRGLLSTVGYYRITQDSAPNEQTYWANVTSGPVSPATASREDLRGSAVRLVDMLAQRYYPNHTRQQLAQRELTVDGAPAYLVRYRAVFDPGSSEGYAAKSEEVAVLVVDTGQDLPSALYVSLPDTVSSLWPSVDGLLSSVRIVR